MKRLRHVFVSPQFENTISILRRCSGRNDNNVGSLLSPVLPDVLKHRKSVEPGKHQIEQHQMNFLIRQDIERALTVQRRTYVIPVAHEIETQHLTKRTMILDDQYR